MKKVLAALVAAVMIFGLAIPSAMATTDDEGTIVTITPEETTEEQDTQSPETDETEDVADETEDDATDEVTEGQDDEEEKLLTPDSPFYFLKRFVESVKLFLTFDEEKKVQLLSELTEERAKELEALQQKFTDGELTEAQFELLEKALDDLFLSTERLVNSLVPAEEEQDPEEDEAQDPETDEGDDETTDPQEDTEEDEAIDDETDEEAGDDVEEPADDETDEEADEEEDDEEYGDKYLRRIAHLQRIADSAPEAAQKGLARAIENALRQRERAIAKGKIPADPVEEPEDEDEAVDDEEDQAEEDETEEPPVDDSTGDGNEAPEGETDETSDDAASFVSTEDEEDSPDFKKDKSNRGNNGRGPKTSPGRGNGKGKKGN